MSDAAVDSPPTTPALEQRIKQLEADVAFLARGVRRAASGQGSAYTAQDFERLDEIAEAVSE